MNINSRIYIAGHRGMVGSAILRKLENSGYKNIITRTSMVLDLRNQQAVEIFFKTEHPEFVFVAAAKVGGIVANNTYRAAAYAALFGSSMAAFAVYQHHHDHTHDGAIACNHPDHQHTHEGRAHHHD